MPMRPGYKTRYPKKSGKNMSYAVTTLSQRCLCAFVSTHSPPDQSWAVGLAVFPSEKEDDLKTASAQLRQQAIRHLLRGGQVFPPSADDVIQMDVGLADSDELAR